MKVKVDHERCVGHGMCVLMGANVFKLDDEGHNSMACFEVAAGLEDEARLGAANCPEHAIQIIEDGG